MGTILLLLLLGWLVCTALLTIGVGARDRGGISASARKVAQQMTQTISQQDISPPRAAVSSIQETSHTPAGVD